MLTENGAMNLLCLPARLLGGVVLSTCVASAMQATPNCPAGWAPVFDGLPGPNHAVRDLMVWDDGSGPAVFAAGEFTSAGGVSAHQVLKWNGALVSPVGVPPQGVYGQIGALAGFDDGSGRAIYAANGPSLFRWNGASWSTFASASPGGLVSAIDEVEVFPSSSGARLIVAGWFPILAGQTMNNIAQWDGTSWAPLGSGVADVPLDPFKGISRVLSFDDGTGPALYVGGRFTAAGGLPANNIAKWNGSTWSALASGLEFPVMALVAFDDGAGAKLYAGGDWVSVANPQDWRLRRWDGAAWSTVSGEFDGAVHGLTVFDDGTGSALYASGAFSHVGGTAADRIARWDGSSWSALGGSLGAGSRAFAAIDFGRGPELYVASGSFQLPSGDVFMSKLGNVCGSTEVFCLGDGSGSACPCGNTSTTAAASGCLNSLGAPGNLVGAGSASLSGDSFALYGSSLPNGGALYFQGTTRVNGGAGGPFGDGLLCVGGSLVRLAVKFSANNWSQYPDVGDPTLSSAGFVTAPGTRDYQVWYRDADTFCTAATYNLTNGLEVLWVP